MKFTIESATSVTIRSVSDHEIRVGGQSYSVPIAITATGAVEEWAASQAALLTTDDFAMLLEANPEIIVLGTGREQELPNRELMFAMARRGIGFEAMHTRAAARTFNVLVSEGRAVAAVMYL